jgi:hypothetical protein
MLEGFCFAASFLPYFHVVTLCMFPIVGWVKYENKISYAIEDGHIGRNM